MYLEWFQLFFQKVKSTCLTGMLPVKIKGYLYSILLLHIFYKNWLMVVSSLSCLCLTTCSTKMYLSILVFGALINKDSVVQFVFNCDFKVWRLCGHSKTAADLGFRVVALPCKNTFLKCPVTGTEVEAQIWNGCISRNLISEAKS